MVLLSGLKSMIFSRRDRKLGVSEKKRRYDLPLDHGESSRFLVLLITLMTFLAVMALAASFALGNMIDRWSSGLENNLTIEIPAEDEDGALRPKETIDSLTEDVFKALQANPYFIGIDLLSQDDIDTLIEPWLGDGLALTDIPLPGLISVRIDENADVDFEALQNTLEKIVPNIHLDTHEDWLGDLLRFAGSLQFAALIVTIIVALTTIIAVTGAIRSRMAEYKDDVELLHFMGASDAYITRQFQRHAFMLGLEGGLFGVLSGGVVIAIIAGIAGGNGAALMPSFVLSKIHVGVLLILPFIVCFITAYSARHTVLRVLSQMP